VVAEHDAEGGVDVEGLRLGHLEGGTGGRVAAMREADVAAERAHVARAEHVAHLAAALVHVERVVLARDDAGGILATVLQEEQPVVEQLVDLRTGDDAEDPAHGSREKVFPGSLTANHSASAPRTPGGAPAR